MDALADKLKALSDPTRLRIVRLLDGGELCVCDLMAALGLPQSKVSRHMSYLKHSGWVSSRRSGKWVYYALAASDNALQARILAILREDLPAVAEAQRDYVKLCAHLENKKTDACQ